MKLVCFSLDHKTTFKAYEFFFSFQLAGENALHCLEETEHDKIEELMVQHGFPDLPLGDENKDKAVQDIWRRNCDKDHSP